MPERGGVHKTVIAAGLITAGIVVAWTGIAVVLAVGIGRVIRRADHEEGPQEPADIGSVADLERIWAQDAAEPQVLLGVVHPGLPSDLSHPEHRA